MLKDNLPKFFSGLIKAVPTAKLARFCQKPMILFKRHINSWSRLGLFIFAMIAVLYYPLGAFLTHSIDTDTAIELSTTEHQSTTVSTAGNLIKREINNKIWTPNLPFFFPSSVLDNMPAFQTGLISAIDNVVNSLSQKLPITDESSLRTAAELLSYPPDIWMFSAQNKLLPAPSSNSQYRRARKHLLKYNEELAAGETVFLRRPQDLRYILKNISNNLQKSSSAIEVQIREHSTDWYDSKSDNIFYLQQGKLYGYYMLLKALAVDYKEIIVAQNIYQPWTALLKSLEDASQLEPFIIRNGRLDSITAPNHLAVMGYYTNRAVWELNFLIQALDKLQQKDIQ